MSIIKATSDKNLFAPWFRDRDTWEAWFVFLAALFGLPMTDEQRAIYTLHTGRTDPPSEPEREATLICGRRAGKSFMMALVAVYLACFQDYRAYLQPGERATVMVIAADRKQAGVIMNYIRGLLTGVPMLKKLIERETDERFDLKKQVTIEVGSASVRTTRGYAFAAVIADELAHWRSGDAAEPDVEVLNALRPGMASIPTAMLLCASSPYARRGALWDAYHRYYGKAGAPLVWKASTRAMNPTVPQSVIDEAMERDPASAGAEYMAEFRTDVETLLTREAVQAAIDHGVYERPYSSSHRYQVFCDPSGGSSDSYTLAIAHAEGGNAVIDAVREVRPPFSPEAVTREYADLIKSYRVGTVTGDRYAGEWPRERFRVHGVTYLLAEATTSELYLALVPKLNSRTVLLTDTPRLENQLIALERRTSRAGRDTIGHPPGPNSHDDLANAVAGAIWLVSQQVVHTSSVKPLRI